MGKLEKLIERQENQMKWMKPILFVVIVIIGSILFAYLFFVGFHEVDLKEECLDTCEQGGACAFTSNRYKLFSCPEETSENIGKEKSK